MIENNIHNDPFFDAFKNAFDDYQPDFDSADLKADWSGVKSHINPSQGASVNNPQIPKSFKSLLNLKNIIITSVTGVAIVATSVIVLNYQKANDSQIIQAKVPTVQSAVDSTKTVYDRPIPKQNNTIGYVDAAKTQDNKQQLTNNTTRVTGNQNNAGSIGSIPALLSNNDQKNINTSAPLKPEPTLNPNIPRIIVSDKGYPKTDEIYVSDTQFCQNQIMRLTYNFKDPAYQKLVVYLQGKQLNESNSNFAYQFAKAGWYNLVLTIQNYTITTSKSYRIHVVSSPVAAFACNISERPMVKFYNQSKYADNYHWYFGDNSTGNNDNPYHRYSDTGTYKVMLIAATDGVCADTTVKYIHVQAIAEPKIPNTFSPNNDGVNDEFYIKIDNEIIYELTIFDRNSTLVFSSKDKNEKWNGNFKDTNKQCATGTYFFFLNYQITGQDQPLVKSGTITLFR